MPARIMYFFVNREPTENFPVKSKTPQPSIGEAIRASCRWRELVRIEKGDHYMVLTFKLETIEGDKMFDQGGGGIPYTNSSL